jgi:hypothetical protein
MSDKEKAPWFEPKRSGYGSGLPIAWQGWAVLVGYLLVTTLAVLLIPWTIVGFIAVVLLATAALVAVCASRTRGGWRWRGGPPKQG